MRRRIAAVAAVVAAASVVLLVSACEHRSTEPPLAAPHSIRPDVSGPITAGTCTTLNQLDSLANVVFGSGTPDVNSVLGKLNNLQHQIDIGALDTAKARAIDIVTFTLSKVHSTQPLPGPASAVTLFVSNVLCYGGLSVPVSDASNTWVVPTNTTDTLVTTNGQAGIIIPSGTFDLPTVITATQLPDTFPLGGGPLNTKLDQYPGFYAFSHTSAGDSTLTGAVTVAVCASSSIASDVFLRLRLGHQASTGFEITPPADASFLNCSGTASTSKSSGWLNALASVFMPKPLYAAMISGGVGGTATSFSPFAPVDPLLSLSTVVAPTCVTADTTVLTPVNSACRPAVSVKTQLGTALTMVPVQWAVGSNGGTVARDSSGTCFAFGSTAATATDANGVARVCWTLGATAGTDTVNGTPSVGGDAPAGVSFSPASRTFTANAVRYPTVTTVSCPASVAWSGSAQTPCTATTTAAGGFSAPTSITYSNNVNVGTATATAAFAGTTIYLPSSASATFQIGRAATVSTVSCPSTILYTGATPNVCTGSVTGPPPGWSLSLTPTYSGNVGFVTASVSYPGDANRLPSSASAQVQVVYVQNNCFASPIYNVMPSTKSAQNKGSNLPVKCSLSAANGSAVLTASASLQIQDMGTDGMTLLGAVSFQNPWKVSNSGVYSYGLDTSPAFFVAGHYYYVTANWNDGSQTKGWFLLK